MIVVVEKPSNTILVQKQSVLRVKILQFNVPSGLTTSVFTQKGEIVVGTGNGTFVVIPPGVDGEYLKYDSSQTAGMKPGVPAISVEDSTNHLINGGLDFAHGMDTPGTYTTIPFDGYGPDQWKSYGDGDLQYRQVDGSGISELRSPYYGEYKKTITGKMLICQPLTFLNTLRFRGRSISFQIKMASNTTPTVKVGILELQSTGTSDVIPSVVSAWNSSGVTPTFGANLALIGTPTICSVTGTFQTFQFDATLPSTSKNLLVVIWSDLNFVANDTLQIAEAGLYYGGVQRLWTPVEKEKDRDRCLYYFERLPNTAAGVFGVGQCFSTTQALVHLNYSEKRSAPSLTINQVASISLTNSGGGGVALASITSGRITRKSAMLTCTVSAGLVAGQSTLLFDNTGGTIDVNARL